MRLVLVNALIKTNSFYILERRTKLYLDYLKELRRICEEFDIEYSKSDRVLYLVDKEFNKGNNIDQISRPF